MTNKLENYSLCPAESIASYFRMINDYTLRITKCNKAIQQIMETLQKEAGKTFLHKEQIYQICQCKKKGTFFFKKLNKLPKIATATYLKLLVGEENRKLFKEDLQLAHTYHESNNEDKANILSLLLLRNTKL